MIRSACSPTEAGCGKCQIARRPQSSVALLLAPANANAYATTVRALQDARLSFQTWGGALALPTGDGSQTFLSALADCLAPATQRDTQAAWFRGDWEDPAQALTAFARAEPLSALLARREHEWVRDALDDGWLFSLFHPIVDARTGETFAHEALIRARHPQTQEVIGAWPIIHACEQLDLQHVLDQRARQTAIRNAAALGHPQGRYFINFLPNTIYDPEICLRTTMQTADECGIEASRLVFEVVETESIPDLGRLKKILDYYRSRGVGTAVDDMGAGFTSAEYLTALQPDYVKLDRALVVEAEQDRASRGRMEAIIGKARDLGIQVIAEGIETLAQRQVCVECGVDYMQGFLFARPANPPERVTWGGEALRLAA